MSHLFYIIEVSDSNFEDILSISTDFVLKKPRCSADETKAILQPRDGEEDNTILEGYEGLTDDQAVEVMQSDEWKLPDNLL